MKVQIVSPEKAAELKKYKFPQPTPADSQYWYDEYGINPLLIRKIDGKLYDCDPDTGVMRYEFAEGDVTGKGAAFAPTLNDLLAKLPDSYRNLKLKPTQILEDGSRADDVDWYADKWIEENAGPDENDGVEWLDMRRV